MHKLPLDGRDVRAADFKWTAEERALRDRLYEAREPYQLKIDGTLHTMYPHNPPIKLSD